MPPPTLSEVKAYPSGTIIEGIGSSDITVTSKSEKARAFVKQGFALRHCFWFNESLRSFRDATKEDPTCAVAWLGVYVAIENPWYRLYSAKKESEYAIQRAVSLVGSASDLEASLIAVYRAKSAGSTDKKFFSDLEQVIKSHPKSNETKLLLAGHMIQTCLGQYDEDGNPQGEFKRAVELASEVLNSDPNSPGAHHYIIHGYEGSPYPEKALKSADALGKVAPKSAHMVHMPGHIYFRVGKYQRAKEVFQRSIELGDQYAKDLNAPATTDWNYSHNLQFASANLLEMGQIKEAKKLAKQSGSDDIEIRIRTNDWDGYNADKANDSFDSPNRVLAYLWQKNLIKAREALGAVKDMATSMNVGKDLTWSRVLRTYAADLEGQILSMEGKHDEAIIALQKACEIHATIAYDEPPYYTSPPEESLGYAYIAANQPDKAVASFEKAFRYRPISGYVYLGIARAKAAMSNKVEAEKAYKKFLDVWKDADADAPGVAEAKAFLSTKK